jgi:hypothetical protein
MINIPIEPIPNQRLSFERGDYRYEVRIFSAGRVMACDVAVNDVAVVLGSRIVLGTPLIPYRYKQEAGNFAFVADDEPWWELFGTIQTLVFYD